MLFYPQLVHVAHIDIDRCHDDELAEEWRNGNFKIYGNMYGNVTKTETEFGDDLSAGWFFFDASTFDTSLLTFVAYISNKVHQQHCTYSWRSMHRSFMSGRTPHSGLNYKHTQHCSKVLLHQGENVIKTIAKVTYPAC